MSFADILESLEKGGRRKLDTKVPSWSGVEITVPASINLQQCSGETAARYKASLVPPGARVADLTGGLGVDSWAFSLHSGSVWYNERDAVLLNAVKRNFAALGVSNVVFNGYDVAVGASEWQEALRAFAPDVIYLDPARRDAAGKKVFLLEDCSPDVVALMPSLLELAPLVIVKVSPMADITMLQRRLSGWLSGIHVVGAEGECKELLCICRREASFDGVVLAEDGFVYESGMSCRSGLPPRAQKTWDNVPGTEHPRSDMPDESGSVILSEAKNLFLFVPSAAMIKSGMGPGMCLMDYDEQLSHFGKFYQVVENLPLASSVLKELGRKYPQAEVTARGVPLSSEQLRSRLRIRPGGPVHIFACTLKGERRILVCENKPLSF